MKKLITLIFLTLICNAVNAQEINMVGQWKVKEIISPKAVENDNIRNMMNGLSESTFHLEQDNSIKITSLNPTEGFRYFTMMANDAIWNFKDNKLTLADKKSKRIIMKVSVSIKDGKTIFTFDETNLVVEVAKTE